MQRLLTILALLGVPAAVLAQDTAAIRTSGQVTTGLQQLDNTTNSSKFTEYRDLRDNLYVFDWRFSASSPAGLFLDLTGANVSRRDQYLDLAAGNPGLWRFDVTWNEIPHLLSNKAQSPYFARSPGVLTVPEPIAIPFKKLATVAADAPAVLANDTVVGAYAQEFGRPVDLGNQTNTGTVGFRYGGLKALDLSVEYTRRTKTGSRLGYGPIGDRPPRTLNIELAEPIDYLTNEVRIGTEFDRGPFQVRLEYLFSDFANRTDDLVWQNVYVTPADGASFEAWDRLIAGYGRRPLAPDNRYHHGTIGAGANLPLGSRLTATFSYGRLLQDQTLLPYAYHADTLANATLPRATADAQMTTTAFSGEYSIMPVRRLTLRAFYRRFQVDNETPASEWQYATQDASNLNGTVRYKNKRVSLPYAWDQQRYGMDVTWRIRPLNGTIGLGYERDDIGREFREAETSEHILRASLRVRPASWLALRAKYLRGDRDGGTYDWAARRQSYWYDPADAGADNDNPQFTFSNHPDMRRYDVSDRRRDRVDVTATVTPAAALSVSATLGYRRDDFDADVSPSQPLLDRSLADSAAATPGDQLGLRRSEQRRISVDLVYTPVERLSLNAFGGWDVGKTEQRSLEFNENNKQNPSAVATADLGPWTRPESQWTADTDDRTRYAGVGASLGVIPGRVSLSASYTMAISTVDIAYDGFGLTNFDGTPYPTNNQFAFQTPPTVRNESHVADVRLEVPVLRHVGLMVGYTYDFYKLTDYQQDVETLWFEPVVSELLLRDTSRSHQWGNRLFNLGRFQAPGYRAHLGYATITYRF